VEQIQKQCGGPQATSASILILLLDQDKSRCIPPIFLSFSFFNHYLYDMFECALSYRNCDSTVVASWLSFRIVLDYPFNSCKLLAMAKCSYRIW
jgi:hypothetical protein